MPAEQRPLVSRRDKSGVRKPTRNETASRKGVDVSACPYGDLRAAGVRCRVIGLVIDDNCDGQSVAKGRWWSAMRSYFSWWPCSRVVPNAVAPVRETDSWIFKVESQPLVEQPLPA